MAMIESLEGRRLLSTLKVGAVTGDNRGHVEIRLSERAVGVRGAAAQMYTAGNDGILGSNDDVRENIRVSYSNNKKTITMRGNLDKNEPYRIKIDGKGRIRSATNGELLDGDYNGTLASGDGNAGGNFEAQFARDQTDTLGMVMRTSAGDINLRLRYDVAPVSAIAFLSLANNGEYDNIAVSRSIAGFIVQLGSLKVNGERTQASDISEKTDAPQFGQELPRVLSNTRGTLSFARGGSAANASNQFFFNLGDNDATSAFNDLDSSGGPGDPVFTPFAEITSSEGYDTIDAMAAKPSADLSSQITLPSNSATGVSDVPVNNVQQAQAGLNPYRDMVIVYRTAAIMTMFR